VLTLCVFEGTSLHCTVKLTPDRSVPCTRHGVTLYGDTRSGKTVSEHFIGTGKACGLGAGSQTSPGLGGVGLQITGGGGGYRGALLLLLGRWRHGSSERGCKGEARL